MSMMEAAQRQTRIDQAQTSRMDSDDQPDSAIDNDDDDDEEYNLDKIISGLATLSGPCGTYAVKEEDELCVIATDPRMNLKTDEEKKLDETNNILPCPLRQGQTVQVVSFDDGVAKLARGAGFIVASYSQLVKGWY